LNRVLVAEISCPDRSEIITPVELQAENIVEFKFEGPAVWQYGSDYPGSLSSNPVD